MHGAGLAAFGETSNPAEYVAREATERALTALDRAVRGGRCAALTAPPGLGKSLLLRLLEKRLDAGFETVFLPYAALAPEELYAWVLGLVGQPAAGDPRASVLRHARRAAEEERPLVLLVDDGNSMPLETARDLGDLIRESGSRVRVILAVPDDASSSRVIAALHPEILEIRCHEPMNPLETRLYIETRLDRAAIPDALRERFHGDTIAWIHRLSGGVPRRVHELAWPLLEDPPEGVGANWKEERWLGAPLDEIDLL